MNTITQVASAMQTLLTETADRLARQCGFVRRQRKLTGAGFAQALALGWMQHPDNSWEQIAATAGAAGQAVSVQALHQRCGRKAAEFLQALLAEATRQAIAGQPQAAGLLARFPHVWVQDSTSLVLPAALQALWPGCGNGGPGGEAGLKLHLRLDLVSGRLVGPLPQAARLSEKQSVLHQDVPPPGSLLLADMGYFQVSRLAQLDREGVFWISGCQPQTAFFSREGQRLALLAWLEQQAQDVLEAPVQIGLEQRLACRLVARRNAPEQVRRLRQALQKDGQRRGRTPSAAAWAWCDWTVVVTNLPPEQATAEELLVLKAARWQVELLFKLWKSQAEIDQAHSHDPWIVLTELFAKLLAVVVGHWMVLTSSWRPVARSLTKAWRTLRGYALSVVGALFRGRDLADVLGDLGRALARTARIFRSRKQPRTHQRLRLAA
jgi:Transposase DDE domain